MINWLKKGAPHTDGKHAEFEAAFRAMEWQAPKGTFSFSGGMLLQLAIEQLPKRPVIAVAEGAIYTMHGLVGLRMLFSGGTSVYNIYILDEGCTALVVATEQLFGDPKSYDLRGQAPATA